MSSDHYFVVTGASGSGKSTLLDALHDLGYSVVPEVGRTIVREQMAEGGRILPWVDQSAFMEEVLRRNIKDHHAAARKKPPVFFDRGVPEVLAWAQILGVGVRPHHLRAVANCRYNSTVFATPPWPEIYVTDLERRQTYDRAVQSYEPTVSAYVEAGYEALVVPRLSVRDRTAFIIDHVKAVPPKQ